MVFIPSGTLFKKAEGKIDYLIVDEAQDFNVSDYKNRFLPKVNKHASADNKKTYIKIEYIRNPIKLFIQ